MPWLRRLVAGQSMSDFWWTKSRLDGYSNEYFGVTVSVSIRQPSVLTDSFIYDGRVNYFKKFNYLGAMITNDARYKREIKSRTTMEKTVFNKKETHFTIKLDSYLRTKLMKCDIWSTALYGTENGTLRYIYHKYTLICF
jgi:hypothetical protein